MQPAAADALSLRRYGPSPGSHSHDHFQVLFGLEGALELEIEGRGRRVAQGEGCVIGPGARHDFEAQRGSLCLVLDSTQPGWAQCLQRAAAPPSHAHPLAQYLAHALQQGRPGGQLPGAGRLWVSAHGTIGPALRPAGQALPPPLSFFLFLARACPALKHHDRSDFPRLRPPRRHRRSALAFA